LVEAVKELKDEKDGEIKRLKSNNLNLENRLKALETKINNLR
jgi:SMC interacting uncharacterized protein involved in chromosome segregation